MKYPHAIIIAAVVLAGAFLISERPVAERINLGQVAVAQISVKSVGDGAIVARADGQVRFCMGYWQPVAMQRATASEPRDGPLTVEQLERTLKALDAHEPGQDTKQMTPDVRVKCSEWS